MILVLDTENTTFQKGNPFSLKNKNVCIAFKTEETSDVLFDDYDQLKPLIEQADLLVFFNAKYDIHWLRKVGLDVRHKKIWCCQAFEFLHERMTVPYPSLNDLAKKYNLGEKLDVIEKEYWEKGIDTDQIPRQTLASYAKQDVELTFKLFQIQKQQLRPHQKMLFNLMMYDLLVLADMEWNGSFFNTKKSKEKASEIDQEIAEIQKNLSLFHSVPNFNWSSNDHLSALLYGGEIKEAVRVPAGVYKSGRKAGQVRYKIEERVYKLPRLYKPPKGSNLKKENKWAVDEDTLLKLEGDKTLIDGILKIKELNKLNSTYFKGFPELQEKMDWEPNILHTTFNMTVTRTGRLSSTKPNIQNVPPQVLELFESRYG